jgi:hypothetical protein
MEPTSTASTRTARLLLGALLAVSLIRAMTQPVTPGEAWNATRYIVPAWQEALSRFDINNHVLYTLLARISTSIGHLTEFWLRLPALLAGAFYLWAVWRIARRWFSGWNQVLIIGLLTLHPMVVDALSEACGYGLGLACWMWALEFVFQEDDKFSGRKLRYCAILLGASVAAALVFLAPAIALLAIDHVRFRSNPGYKRLRVPEIAFLVAFCLLMLPMNHAEWSTLAQGLPSILQTAREMSRLAYGTSRGIVASLTELILIFGGGLVGVALAAAGWRQKHQALGAIVGASSALTMAIFLWGNVGLHTRYPAEGSVIFVPIITLVFSSIIFKVNSKSAQLGLQIAGFAVLATYLIWFPATCYRTGKEVETGRTFAKALRSKVGRSDVRIAVNADLEPVLGYYRERYGQANWQLVPIKPLAERYDYYVLTPPDRYLIGTRHLHEIYRDEHLTLAQ